ncbi:hypothetical protein CMI37_29275 [Candidatus Pacearchaeota archaeon]|nr:hypothetical protein [Candidatus Pacearchaeota archaeon]
MVFTDVGANEIRDWLAGDAATAPTHFGVGDDNTAETKADTALANELTTDTIDTDSTSDKQVEYTWTLLSTEQNSQSLKEVGLFNAAAAGDMFTRATHATVAKTSSIEVRYKIRVRLVN